MPNQFSRPFPLTAGAASHAARALSRPQGWLLVICLFLASGCASADRVDTHPTWPTEQGVWKLYESEGQLVYATGGRAANQVGKFVREVSDDYRSITGEDPSPVVPVAFAAGDDPPLQPFETRWLEMVLSTKQYLDALRDSEVGVSNANLIASLEPIAESPELDTDDPEHFRLMDMIEKDIPPSSIVSLTPVFCRPEHLGLTTSAGALTTYLPFLPSSARRADALTDMIEAGMRAQGLSWWKRTLAAPIIAMMKGKLEAKMADVAKFALFEVQVLTREPRFSAEERQRYLDEYSEKIGLREPPDFSEVRVAAKELEAKLEAGDANGEPAPSPTPPSGLPVDPASTE